MKESSMQVKVGALALKIEEALEKVSPSRGTDRQWRGVSEIAADTASRAPSQPQLIRQMVEALEIALHQLRHLQDSMFDAGKQKIAEALTAAQAASAAEPVGWDKLERWLNEAMSIAHEDAQEAAMPGADTASFAAGKELGYLWGLTSAYNALLQLRPLPPQQPAQPQHEGGNV